MPYTRDWVDSVKWYRDAYNDTNRSYSTANTSLVSTRTGEALPHWKTVLRLRQDATTPYSIDAVKLDRQEPVWAVAEGFSADGLRTTSSFDGFYTRPSAVSHLTTNQVLVRNEALNRAYSKLNQARSHLNGLAVVGEFGSVLNQLKRPFAGVVQLSNNYLDRLARSTRGLSGTERQRRASADRILADSYIEYAFGLKPLISDTEAIAEALARYRDEYTDPVKTLITAGSSMTNAQTLYDVAVLTGSRISSDLTTIRKTEFSVRYKICTDLDLVLGDAGSLQRLFELLGFTPSNFIPAAWEVLPWSWLVDYFSNIQELITAACSSSAGIRYIVKSERLRTEATYYTVPNWTYTQQQFSSVGYPDKFSMRARHGVTRLIRTTYVRSKEQKLGMPSLVFEFPTSITKAANMAAVLLQRRSPVTYFSYYAKRFT